MSETLSKYFRMAVNNIASGGDTDVFPLPPENSLFFDRADEAVAILDDLHTNFDKWKAENGPVNESALAMVGYTSFRWVAQLDPIWNAYLLGLVLSMADDIEATRISTSQQTVFSYRYDYDPATHRLFRESAWRHFNEQSLRNTDSHEFVLTCDISDFYPRIYHHRLENSLLLLRPDSPIPHRIDRVLNLFSGGISYGLPVGGPAARLLSEILLNRVDHLLFAQGITFCRFADDYHLFINSREEAYEALRFLTEKLLRNEGLTLQRAKTQIVSSRDFRETSEFTTQANQHDQPNLPRKGDPLAGQSTTDTERERRQNFLAVSLRYDPYSPTAEEDYFALREQVERFDILGMLARELSKSRIHVGLTRRLVLAVRYLGSPEKDGAVRTLVDNMATLSPVLANVLRALTQVFDDLSTETKNYVSSAVQKAISEQLYFMTVPVTLAYAVRLLGKTPSEENQAVLIQMYDDVPAFIQRDIVVIMSHWRAAFWLSDRRHHFGRMHPWVQRAFVMASYFLADEGRHWRKRVEDQLSPLDLLASQWTQENLNQGSWEIPL
jgi:reverse transcriptase-like protein